MMRVEDISDNEILRYMGASGGAGLEADLARAKALVAEAATPRWVTGVFAIERRGGDLALRGADVPLAGKALAALLKNCGEAVLLAATIGIGVDLLIERARARSMAEAALLDAAASAAVEALCERVNGELSAGRRLTRRYSCGYGDWPLAAQPSVLAALDAERRVGVTCGPGHLMRPTKSVTAILGVLDTGQADAAYDACAFCLQARDCAERGMCDGRA